MAVYFPRNSSRIDVSRTGYLGRWEATLAGVGGFARIRLASGAQDRARSIGHEGSWRTHPSHLFRSSRMLRG